MLLRRRGCWASKPPPESAKFIIKTRGDQGYSIGRSVAASERHFMLRVKTQLPPVDLYGAKEIHITFCPNEGYKKWHESAKQNWFKSNSHQVVEPLAWTPRLDLNAFYPLHGLSERFEDALRCLELLCQHIAPLITPGVTSLTFDFIAFAPADAGRLLDCLGSLPPLKHVALKFGGLTYPFQSETGWEMPAGGRRIIQDLLATRAHRLVTWPQNTMSKIPSDRPPTPLPFMKFPPELREMILSYVVSDTSAVPLQNRHLKIETPFYRLRARRCCGQCRVLAIPDDHACRCTSTESYSTTCSCVSLSDGVFFVSHELRAEALRMYWMNNSFLVHGPMGEALQGARLPIEEVLLSVPKLNLRMIRHLILDTDWHVRGFEPPEATGTLLETPYLPRDRAWGNVLRYLEAHGGPWLTVEIQSIRTSLKGSYAWRRGFINPGASLTLEGMEKDIAVEIERFKTDVKSLNLRVRVIEIFHADKKTLLLDHWPNKRSEHRIST